MFLFLAHKNEDTKSYVDLFIQKFETLIEFNPIEFKSLLTFDGTNFWPLAEFYHMSILLCI